MLTALKSDVEAVLNLNPINSCEQFRSNLYRTTCTNTPTRYLTRAYTNDDKLAFAKLCSLRELIQNLCNLIPNEI
ncbi:hypothetical protein D3C77_753660 [compost metagenome]